MFQIGALSDFLLYTKSIIAFLMPLLIIVQLFVDALHSNLMPATLLSHVVVVVTSNLLWAQFAPTIVVLIQVLVVGLIIDMM